MQGITGRDESLAMCNNSGGENEADICGVKIGVLPKHKCHMFLLSSPTFHCMQNSPLWLTTSDITSPPNNRSKRNLESQLPTGGLSSCFPSSVAVF